MPAMPEASAAGHLQLARQRHRRTTGSSARCVACGVGRAARRSCHAIAVRCWMRPRLPRRQLPAWTQRTVRPSTCQHGWWRSRRRCRAAGADADGPVWPPGQQLRGGIGLLELPSPLCPFRSFAELRLQARPLPQPSPGIDPRLRGQMLHLALERFWRATGDSATLHGRSREATQALVRALRLVGKRTDRRAPARQHRYAAAAARSRTRRAADRPAYRLGADA